MSVHTFILRKIDDFQTGSFQSDIELKMFAIIFVKELKLKKKKDVEEFTTCTG